jgi:hypothetical protein
MSKPPLTPGDAHEARGDFDLRRVKMIHQQMWTSARHEKVDEIVNTPTRAGQCTQGSGGILTFSAITVGNQKNCRPT